MWGGEVPSPSLPWRASTAAGTGGGRARREPHEVANQGAHDRQLLIECLTLWQCPICCLIFLGGLGKDGYQQGWVSGPMPGLSGWRRGLGGARGCPGNARWTRGCGGGLRAWRHIQRPGHPCPSRSLGPPREGYGGTADRAGPRVPGQVPAGCLHRLLEREPPVRVPGLPWRVRACQAPMAGRKK